MKLFAFILLVLTFCIDLYYSPEHYSTQLQTLPISRFQERQIK
jgi:hypothetical protein